MVKLTNGNGGVWKQIALVAVAVMIAGAPGITYALRTWALNDEVSLIRERQDDVRGRLAVLEAEHAALETRLTALTVEIQRLIEVLGGTRSR